VYIDRLLQEDPVLFQLYKDLVVANVITAEEFWANRFTVSYLTYFYQPLSISQSLRY